MVSKFAAQDKSLRQPAVVRRRSLERKYGKGLESPGWFDYQILPEFSGCVKHYRQKNTISRSFKSDISILDNYCHIGCLGKKCSMRATHGWQKKLFRVCSRAFNNWLLANRNIIKALLAIFLPGPKYGGIGLAMMA
jgi:hypothetical protein